jgi:dTDP-4-dehydrorhamnose 3,5-epimerase
MKFSETSLPGVYIIEPKRFGDHRGWFMESWNQLRMIQMGLNFEWMQDNHSYSAVAGTVRGLHYQAPPHAQDKLVRVGRGSVWDVAVDARRGSPTFGKWIGVELSAENGLQLLIPKGFLHGFATLTADVELLYKCSDVYAPDCDGAVIWNDPQLGIDWKIGLDSVILSEKDAAAPTFSDWQSPFEWSPT